MLQKAALVFGAVFILIALLGSIPAFAPENDMGMPVLLGIFMVGIIHNIIHLLSGVAAVVAGKTSEAYAQMYFKLFGVVYAVVTLVGFVQKDTVLGLIHVNLADNLLHLAIAAVTLYLGFAYRPHVKTTV